MENIKGIQYNDCNVMVYIKTNKKYEALSNIKEFTIAPNLMYASLFPYDKLERLKEWADIYKQLFIDHGHSLQIRSAKDRKKVLYQIN